MHSKGITSEFHTGVMDFFTSKGLDKLFKNDAELAGSVLTIDNKHKFNALKFQMEVLYKGKEITKDELEEAIKEAELCDSKYKLKAYKVLKLIGYSKDLETALKFEDNPPKYSNGKQENSREAFKRFIYILCMIEGYGEKINAIDDGMQKEIFGELAKSVVAAYDLHIQAETINQGGERVQEKEEAAVRLVKQMGVTIFVGAGIEIALATTALAIPPVALASAIVIVGAATVAALAIEGKYSTDRIKEIDKKYANRVLEFLAL